MFRPLILIVFAPLVMFSVAISDDVLKEKNLDQMSKQEILASPRWRRAEKAMEDWLSLQFYTPEEVNELEARCDAHIKTMEVAELRDYLRDAEARLDILMSPEVQRARDWVGSYMAVLAAPQRDRLQQKLPDVSKMTAPELEQAVRDMLQVKQMHGQRGRAEQSRRQSDVTRGRTENARQAENRNSQMQQRQQTQANRANDRSNQAHRNSIENARSRAQTTPEWYRRRNFNWGWWR